MIGTEPQVITIKLSPSSQSFVHVYAGSHHKYEVELRALYIHEYTAILYKRYQYVFCWQSAYFPSFILMMRNYHRVHGTEEEEEDECTCWSLLIYM